MNNPAIPTPWEIVTGLREPVYSVCPVCDYDKLDQPIEHLWRCNCCGYEHLETDTPEDVDYLKWRWQNGHGMWWDRYDEQYVESGFESIATFDDWRKECAWYENQYNMSSVDFWEMYNRRYENWMDKADFIMWNMVLSTTKRWTILGCQG